MDVPLSDLVSSFKPESVSLKTESGDDLTALQSGAGNTEPQVPEFSYVFSNLATKTVYDMLANGAETDGEEQEFLLHNSFGKPLVWVNEIFPYAGQFFTATGKAGGPIISFAPAVWVDSSVNLKEAFNKVLHDTYKPDFFEFDMSSEESTEADALKKEVNEWGEKKSGGLVPDPLGSHVIGINTRLIFSFALEFQGKWFEPFEDAGVQDFTLLNGDVVKVPFMTSKGKHYVKQFEKYKLLSVPFQQHEASEFSMLFYLTDDINDTLRLREFIGIVENVFQDVYFPEEQVQVGNFLIPKFTLSVRGMMPLLLESGGPFELPEMAESPANLNTRKGVISSFLELEESGIRAGGVTTFFVEKPPEPDSGEVAPTPIPYSMDIPVDEKIDFVANRPFLFFIRDNKFGRMLFCGGLLNAVGQSVSFKGV